MLKLENIHAGYGLKEVLKGVSLEISAGEIVALLGPNGAGKSTVLKIIAGMLAPTTGTVTYREQNITQMPTYRRARNGIGYLMQNGPMFGSLTVAEHQRLAASNEPKPTIPGITDRRVGVLSGGERQRLAVDLCLRRNPRLLLLDEPSASVAPAAAAEIYAEIKDRITGTNTAVLIVEHRLCSLTNFVTRVKIIRSGRICRDDFPIDSLENSEAMFEAFYSSGERE